jgi:hypothetical protein
MSKGLRILIIGILLFVGVFLFYRLGVNFITWQGILGLASLITAGYLLADVRFP